MASNGGSGFVFDETIITLDKHFFGKYTLCLKRLAFFALISFK